MVRVKVTELLLALGISLLTTPPHLFYLAYRVLSDFVQNRRLIAFIEVEAAVLHDGVDVIR